MDSTTRAESLRVGFFVLLALSLLIFGSLWVVGSGVFGSGQSPYMVWLDDSGAVSEGDLVRVAGVGVGRIRRIELRDDPEWPVALAVTLRADLEIRADASALITSDGVLGSSFLAIDPGSPGARPLSPGDVIHGEPAVGFADALQRVDQLAERVLLLVEQTSGTLEQVAADIEPILEGMHAFVSQKNAESLGVILSELQGTLEQGGPRLVALLDRLDGVAVQLEQGTQALPELGDQASRLLADLDRALGPDGQRLTDVLAAAESGLLSADEAMSVLHDNREPITAALEDLRATMDNLEAFSRQIRERPFSLIRMRGEPDRRPGDGNGGRR